MSVKDASSSNGADIVQKGTGSNTNEQWSIVEVPCAITRGDGIITDTDPAPKEEFTVSVLPNPSTDYFTVIVKSSDLETPVSVRILDVNGEVLSVSKTGINSSLKVGDTRWANGMYFAEVTQGGQRKVVKLIKAN